MEAILEDFHIQLEECRNKVTSYQSIKPAEIQSFQVTDCHTSLDTIFRIIQSMQDAIPMTMETNDVYVAMAKNCTMKAKHFCAEVVDTFLNSESQTVIDDGLECQQAIAQMMEIYIRVCYECDEGAPVKLDIDDKYANYQRALLRQRSKPSIAALANIRKIASSQSIPVMEYIETNLAHDEDHNDENDVEQRPHANAIAMIFGEASSLIHPLLMWNGGICGAIEHLSEQSAAKVSETTARINDYEINVQKELKKMCEATIETLHRESSKLGCSVGRWFLDDNYEFTCHIDSHLDEMAFICQVLHRYSLFCKEFADDNQSNNEDSIEQHMAEHIVLYSTTESKLFVSNIDRVIDLAQPVQILMGIERYVPSVVEDAYYISQRCLERCSSTLSSKTIVLTANAVTDTWSLTGKIHDALMNQKGCCIHRDLPEKEEINEIQIEKAPSSGLNSFLKMLDKEIDHEPEPKRTTQKAPKSGSLDEHEVQIQTQLTLLNGIHGASSACTSLADLFDTLLPEDENPQTNGQSSMITVAKEQLQSYAKLYDELLESQIQCFLEEWIGKVLSTENPPPLIASLPHSPSIHRLFYHVSQQNYDLNASTIAKAESAENLNNLIAPFEQSRLMKEINNGKCDDYVASVLLKNISHSVVNLFYSTLIDQKQKRFSEWGSLLLAKQIRTLEEYFCSYVVKNNGNTNAILSEFKKMAQAITILQCSSPRDWVTTMQHEVGDSKFDLNQDDVKKVMSLRGDWTQDLINAACNKK